MTKNVLISISLSINPPGQKLLVGCKFPLISFHCRVQTLIHIKSNNFQVEPNKPRGTKKKYEHAKRKHKGKKRKQNKMKTNLFALL